MHEQRQRVHAQNRREHKRNANHDRRMMEVEAEILGIRLIGRRPSTERHARTQDEQTEQEQPRHRYRLQTPHQDREWYSRRAVNLRHLLFSTICNGGYLRERRFAFVVESPDVAIITSVDLMIAIASSPRRSFSARTASAVMTAVSD